jgi:phage-related holin
MRGPNDGTMSFEELIMELVKAHGWKAALSLILSWIGMQLLPVAGFMIAGTVLVFSDWITGMTASYIHKRPFTSRGLFRTVQKVTFYCMAIILTRIVENTFFNTTFMIYMVAAYIALVELYSNLENISDITGTNVLAVVKKAVKVSLLGRKSFLDPDKHEKKEDK